MASAISSLLGSGKASSSSWLPFSGSSSTSPSSWLPFSGSSSTGSVTDTLKNAVSAVNPLSSNPKPAGLLDQVKGLVPGLSPSSTGLAAILMGGAKDDSFFTKMYQNLGLSSTLSTVLGYISYILYQQFINKDPRTAFEFVKSHLGQVLSLIPGVSKIPGLSSLVASIGKSGNPISAAALNALSSLKKDRPSFLSNLNPLNWSMFNKKQIKQQKDDEAYQAGEPYGDPEVVSTGLADDLKAIGLRGAPKDLEVLIGVVKNKGKPMDDRKMDVEKLIALAASLPTNSKSRKKLTGVLIDTLWSSLQHPPMSYLGNKYQYRTPDGSYNNPLMPDLGKAGSPYAKTVKKLKHQKGCQPDPGMLFDFLMARTPESFKENPAGISSMLFYHATIIIHDIFNSNRFDHNISDTSSYLDLAPLYGSNLDDQLKIRTMQGGLLKPDTFSEKRLLGQPPGVNVVLVMYSRFHNYCAETLLKINEYDRFSLPQNISSDDQMKAAVAKQDEDLFQTARLITNGLYINICLYDYLRGLTNAHHSATTWTLDPRADVDRLFDAEGVPKGTGNQISAEFNLLYRFHSTISLRDEAWMNDFMGSLFPDINKPFSDLTPQEFIQGLFRFEQSIPKEPEKREFGGLKRGADGKFNNADLVKIMKESCEDPAGLFGARMVPKALKMVEIAGILSSRKWQLASLNEMRDFFKLKRHETFEDLNPDPEIADLLRKFYQHPDMVEMYPGLFLEDAKPRMDPGCGGCPPYTVGRAVFSDAVTLVRSDRFLTIDYTTSTLTNWGMAEVQYDLRVLGGSMYWKLFQRALPGWFPYNSLHIMQPMFTRKMNEQIAREIGTIDLYTMDDPKPPAKPVLIANGALIQKVLANQDSFKVAWERPLDDLFPGKKNYSSYMLSGDKSENTAQRNLVGGIMYASPDITKLISDTTLTLGEQLMKKNTFSITSNLNQIDIVRDVAIPLNARILNDLFCLDMETEDNPTGSLTTNELYKYLTDFRTWGFDNTDVGMAWKRRMWAQEAAKALETSTKKSVTQALAGAGVGAPGGIVSSTINTGKSLLGKVPVIGGLFEASPTQAAAANATATLKWFGGNMVKELALAGQTPDQIADICWLTAVGGIGVVVGVFASVLEYFLKPENSDLWSQVQRIATSGTSETINKALRPYILEAQRLTSAQQDFRICVDNLTIDGQAFKPGDAIVTLLGIAGRNPATVPDPDQFKLDRPAEAYLHFGNGPHKCLGREVAIAFVTGLVRLGASTKALRQAPDKMGRLKAVMMGPGNTEKLYMNDSWSYLTKDPSTWTLHFDGYGKGVYQAPTVDVAQGRDLNTIFNALKQQAADDKPDIPQVVKDADSMPPPPIAPEAELAKAVVKGPNIDGPVQANGTAPPDGVTQPDPTAVTNGTGPTDNTAQPDGAAQTNGTTQAGSQPNGQAPTPTDAVNGANGANGTSPASSDTQTSKSTVPNVVETIKQGADTVADGTQKVANDALKKLQQDNPVDDSTPSTNDINVNDTNDHSFPISSEPTIIFETPQSNNNTIQTQQPLNDIPVPTSTNSDVKAPPLDTIAVPIPQPDSDNTQAPPPASNETEILQSASSDTQPPQPETKNDQNEKDNAPAAAVVPSRPLPDWSQNGASLPALADPILTTTPPTNDIAGTPAATGTTKQPSIASIPSVTSVGSSSAPMAISPATPAPATVAQPVDLNDGFDPKQPVTTKVQTGKLSADGGDYTRGIGIKSFDRTVQFPQQYDKPPRVVLSINNLDISASGSPVDFSQSATKITRTGFTWSAKLNGTRHWALGSGWLAIPDTNDYKNVTTAVYDTRSEGSKSTDPRDKTSERFLRTLDVSSLHPAGSTYSKPPTVVTWLTGFSMKIVDKNQIPSSFKIRADKGDQVTGSSVDIVVSCRPIDAVISAQTAIILLPSDDSSQLSTFFHNAYDTAIALPFVIAPQSRSATFFPRPFLSSKKIQNTIGLAGLDFSKTGTSVRFRCDTSQGVGSWSASVGTWFDGAPNSITGWVVTSEQ